MLFTRRKRLALQALLGPVVACAVAGCSRGTASKAPERAQPAASAPAGATTDEEAPLPAEGAPGDRVDGEKKEKAAEEPSLHQPPAEEALGPQALEEEEVLDLEREERQFQEAIDPEALSCAGALPRRDAICSLAAKICELSTPTSLSAQKDCEKAQSACTNAKATYRSRCGG
jgi:hypothetical protein